MNAKKYLVVGATGHVGSKVAVLLANKGYDVTALVRQQGATIRDPCTGTIRYVTGDLSNEQSIACAVKGMDVVISTANGVTPQNKGGTAKAVNEMALRLITLCEQANVRRFVQSSVPPYRNEHRVPELIGKRRIEERLRASPMQSVVIRNPAFMDVFLVMSGFKQAADRSAHATTKRNFGLGKFWLAMAGNLVEKWGLLIAPGGANHGSPMIATRDVAEMLVGGALYAGTDNLLIEAGGPQWLTWRADRQHDCQESGSQAGSHSCRCRRGSRIMNKWMARPFSRHRRRTRSPSWGSWHPISRGGIREKPSASWVCRNNSRLRTTWTKTTNGRRGDDGSKQKVMTRATRGGLETGCKLHIQ